MDGEGCKHTDSRTKSEQRPRRDLLRSYGSAIMTIGERTYKKIEEQDGTIGWLARKLAFIVFPVLWWIRFQWLSHLSFIDKQIQTVGWIASKISPPSKHIFLKIDGLARFADSLPDKVESVIDAIVDFIGQLPGPELFNWAIELVEEIFKGVMSVVPDFGSSNADIHQINDIGSAYERNENLKMAREEIENEIKNVEEGLEEGAENLEKIDAVEGTRTKNGGSVSTRKP